MQPAQPTTPRAAFASGVSTVDSAFVSWAGVRRQYLGMRKAAADVHDRLRIKLPRLRRFLSAMSATWGQQQGGAGQWAGWSRYTRPVLARNENVWSKSWVGATRPPTRTLRCASHRQAAPGLGDTRPRQPPRTTCGFRLSWLRCLQACSHVQETRRTSQGCNHGQVRWSVLLLLKALPQAWTLWLHFRRGKARHSTGGRVSSHQARGA